VRHPPTGPQLPRRGPTPPIEFREALQKVRHLPTGARSVATSNTPDMEHPSKLPVLRPSRLVDSGFEIERRLAAMRPTDNSIQLGRNRGKCSNLGQLATSRFIPPFPPRLPASSLGPPCMQLEIPKPSRLSFLPFCSLQLAARAQRHSDLTRNAVALTTKSRHHTREGSSWARVVESQAPVNRQSPVLIRSSGGCPAFPAVFGAIIRVAKIRQPRRIRDALRLSALGRFLSVWFDTRRLIRHPARITSSCSKFQPLQLVPADGRHTIRGNWRLLPEGCHTPPGATLGLGTRGRHHGSPPTHRTSRSIRARSTTQPGRRMCDSYGTDMAG